MTPAARAAATARSALARSRVIGFSTWMCLPAAAAARIWHSCRLCGVASTTASTVASARTCSKLSTRATPCARQKFSAAARVRVWPRTKQMSSLLPCTEATSERPQRPRPMIAARIMQALTALLGPARRDHRQQQMRRHGRAEMQGVDAAENVRRAVARIGMGEWADPLHRIDGVRRRRVGAVVFVVLAAHAQADAVALRHHDRGRPDLDVELDRFAGGERPFLVVAVPGPIGQALFAIELAVRGAQPAEPDRRARIVAADEHDLPATRIEHAQ